jgi:hypothetical protein
MRRFLGRNSVIFKTCGANEGNGLPQKPGVGVKIHRKLKNQKELNEKSGAANGALAGDMAHLMHVLARWFGWFRIPQLCFCLYCA